MPDAQTISLPTPEQAREHPNIENCVLQDMQWGDKIWLFGGEKNWFYQRQLGAKRPNQSRYTTQFLKLLPDAQHIIDVGANIGMMSMQYAKAAKKVSAFEPTPRTVQLLIRNLALHDCTNVDVYQAALSDHTGQGQLMDWCSHDGQNSLMKPNPNRKRTTSTPLDVALMKLDDFHFDDVSGIKVDVEGHELSVLIGANDTIYRCRPIVQLEIMETTLKKFRKKPQDVYDWMLARDYTPYDSKLQKRDDTWSYIRHECDVIFVPKEKQHNFPPGLS